MSYP
ncbi:TPA_asm: US6 uORF [Human alphaherpesvirus 1]|jgi:hypothetical protein